MTAMKIPPSVNTYDPAQSLLDWMESNRRQSGDIYQASIYGSSAYVVSKPEYAEHVLRSNWRNYKKGSAITRVAMLLGKGLMVSEGKLWKKQRRMVHPAFHHKAIAEMTSVIIDANALLLRGWERAAERAESVNVTRDISLMTLEILLKVIFGEDYGQCAPYFRIVSEETARDLEFVRSFRSLGNVILQLADQRRQRPPCPQSDMLGMLMEVCDPDDGQPMPNNRLVDEVLTLIVAGHETTASTLSWMWYLLSQNAAAERKLHLELGGEPTPPGLGDVMGCRYARHVIEETLRLYPAGWLITRRALNDDQIGGYFVPAGTEIYIPLYIIQRHPDLWKDPNRFDPDRFEPDRAANRHLLATLPFSAGPRNCIGEHLARLEMQIHLVTIARTLRLQYLDERPLELDLGVNLRNKHDFMMMPKLR